MNAVDVRLTAPPAVRDAGGTATDPLRVRWAWWRSRRHRGRLHTRPLLAPSPAGRSRLPGTDVETLLVEAPDPYRRPCALVLVPETGHVSAVLDVAPPAPGAVPPGGFDPGWTADVGAWLALLAHEPQLAGCAVIMPGRGPTGAGPVRGLVQLTWRVAALSGGADPPAAAIEVLTRVPRLVRSLAHSAVGTARPLTAADLAAVVRDAYHPASGAGRPGGRRPWGEADPVAPVEKWHEFRHGGSASLTWSLGQVPPDVVLATALPQLTAVPGDLARTRVTLLHHPGDVDQGGGAPRPARLTSLVTVTATPDVLPTAADALLERLPAPLRPWLRPVYGSQAAAFAAGLPTGTLLATHAAPPSLKTGSDERGP